MSDRRYNVGGDCVCPIFHVTGYTCIFEMRKPHQLDADFFKPQLNEHQATT